MKVLHIINSLEIGGAEKLIIDSLPIYKKNGIDADVVLLKDSKTFFRDKIEKEMGVNIDGLTKKSIYNPFLIFRLMPYLKKYDIIHGHLFPTLYWIVLTKLLSLSSIPIIYTEHSTSNRRRDHWLFKYIDKFFYKNLSAIGCISTGTYDTLSFHLKSKEKLVIIENGINIENYMNKINDRKISFNYFKGNDNFIIIQISSFRPQKDQATLIRALAFLPGNVKLLLVGEGELKKNNEQLMNELGLQNRIKFLGSRQDIPELLSCSDVVVLSSHYEGFGLAAVEGMAAGKPVIASNVSGLKEVVAGYGILFEAGDVIALSEEINKLYNDSSYYNKISKKCVERATHFSIDKMVKSYIKLYQKIIISNRHV